MFCCFVGLGFVIGVYLFFVLMLRGLGLCRCFSCMFGFVCWGCCFDLGFGFEFVFGLYWYYGLLSLVALYLSCLLCLTCWFILVLFCLYVFGFGLGGFV